VSAGGTDGATDDAPGATRSDPVDEQPQVIERAVRVGTDPDSPGAGIARDEHDPSPDDLPEPNEPG
jgi:hypothetical protein